jgi:phosphatidylserine/phosphatidylglycerophosphate/cardiolipin synthase-like enzyme
VGRNGATPRQDMSAMVAGPILENLNENFCRAWLRDAKEDLFAKRNGLDNRLQPREAIGDHTLVRVMAQITRTQSQEGVRDIEKLYLQAVNNATQFIYIENQYFRWPALAQKIKDAVHAQICAGRDPARPVHLFVVTNANKDGIGQGPGTTFDMLDSLGRADAIPTIARAERNDMVATALQDARKEVAAANTRMRNAGNPQEQAAAQREMDSAKSTELSLQKQYDHNLDMKNAILPQTIPGLKVHVCSLVAPDSPVGSPWTPVYVHSKIMIIDDVFLTHGSANVNRRSMEVDSELNICHERGDVTRPLRRHLWEIHTGGVRNGASDRPDDAAMTWEYIIKRNSQNQANNLAPVASLVGFVWIGASRLRLD